MRIPSKSDKAEHTADDVPLEVKIWLDKGWVIIPTERRGYVLSGQKAMRSLDKVGIAIGVALQAGYLAGYKFPGIVGAVVILGSWLDYKYNTKPPTKFFPESGEKSRVMERE